MKNKISYKKTIRIKANKLAKEANNGNDAAKQELLALIDKSKYLKSLVKKADKRFKKQVKLGRKKKKGELKGSIMTGLAGVTNSRPWKYIK